MDDRRDEELLPDEAVFAPARLTRGRPPVAAAAIALIVGALALAGLLGEAGARSASSAVHDRTDSTAVIDPARFREAPWRSRPGTGEPFVTTPMRSSAPARLTLDARTSGRHLFVAGDVYTRGAVVVIVSINDGDNQTLEIRSVDMPGGSTAFRTGPNDRFSLMFEVDRWPAAQVAWVMANAYDEFGNRIESVRTLVPLSSDHGRWRAGAGL